MDLLHLVEYRIEFTRDTRFHFYHHPALYAALLDRLGNPPGRPPAELHGVALYTPESARTSYRQGDFYHFGIAFLPGAHLTPAAVAELLRRPPCCAAGKRDSAPFGSNFRLVQVRDCVADSLMARSGPTALTLPSLLPLAQNLSAQHTVRLRFLSPLELYRTPVDKRTHIMDGEVFQAGKFLRHLQNDLATWYPEAEFLSQLPTLPDETPLVQTGQNRMVRTDITFRSYEGSKQDISAKDAPRPKRLIGSSGCVDLRFPDGVGPWALPLLLGGIVGVGKSHAMGMGRFRLEEFPLPCAWPPRPALTLCQRAADPRNLMAAVEQMRLAGRAPGIDMEPLDEFMDNLTARIPELRQSLNDGTVTPSPLRGLLIQRKNEAQGTEKLCPLAIPTITDRFLQRAVFLALEPALDSVFEESSYAYRRGLSHLRARDGVRAAREQGFTHVLDADIKAFFDEVDWDLLRIRLEAYLGDDPVVNVLMAWIKAPVEFEDRTIHRNKGLPQGAVVSPLLANLYLDQLDEAIEALGFKLVRYADDFVVLGKKAQDMQALRQSITEELQRLHLTLNQQKTSVVSYDQGFHFLGAFFCRSVVLEVAKDRNTVESVLTRLPPSLKTEDRQVPLSGWLADFFNQPDPRQAQAELPAPGSHQPIPPPSGYRRGVYVVTHDTQMQGRKQGLILTPPKQRPIIVSWNHISELVLLGSSFVPSSVIQRALANRVPISLHQRDGTPAGMILPQGVRCPSPTTVRQWEAFRDDAFRLQVARTLVAGKIRNIRISSRRRPAEGTTTLLAYLSGLEQKALSATDPDILRGIEGQAAHAYFQMWPKWVDVGFADFPGRKGRGATDPLNVMLNLLYSQLYRLTQTTLFSVGLDPFLGAFHIARGRYAALASDMMESFRFLVDRIIINAINHHHVRPGDVSRSEKAKYPVMLKPEAVKRLLGDFEEAMTRTVADVSGRADTHRGHLYRQCLSLRRLICGEVEAFEPFTLKW